MRYLRTQGDAMADQTRQIVSDLSYAGDEGGIVCHMLPSEEGGGALVVSLTTCPCAAIIALCGGRCRLSNAPSEETKEAGPRESEGMTCCGRGPANEDKHGAFRVVQRPRRNVAFGSF